jgi:hypothetical protein
MVGNIAIPSICLALNNDSLQNKKVAATGFEPVTK